jgi:hypothetical protein
VDLKKAHSYVNWPAPVRPVDGSTLPTRLLLGGKGEAQKKATAQQLASFQIQSKLPGASAADVYARPLLGDGSGEWFIEEENTRVYFVGKVVGGDGTVAGVGATAISTAMALTAQEALVKEHARLLIPAVFAPCAEDGQIELWLAPINSEVSVSQNELALERWTPDEGGDGNELPPQAAALCGFSPETVAAGATPYYANRDGEGRPLKAAFKANIQPADELEGLA